MVCIYCSGKTQVVNSRLQKRDNRIWRRRRCINCQSVFTSIEEAHTYSSIRVASGTTMVPYSRDKLFVSIYESCRHRPTALEDAGALTDTIAHKVFKEMKNGSITKLQIKKTAIDVMKRFDNAAAVHYEAYYL